MKYPLASPAWVAFMHGVIEARLIALGEGARSVNFSICEVFTDPPGAAPANGARLAWHCIVSNGVVTACGPGEREDVDFRAVADYDAIAPLARYDTQGDAARAAELTQRSRELLARGLLQVHGTRRPSEDPRVGNLHDPLARVTA